MFAAFLNIIPLRIRQPYEKLNFHINCFDEYKFMEKEITCTTSIGGGALCLFVCLRFIIFKGDSSIYIFKGIPDDISVFVMRSPAISFW